MSAGSAGRPRVLVLDNHDSFTWNLVQLLEGLGAECRVCRSDGLEPEAALGLEPDGIVLSPGPFGPERTGICASVVRRAGCPTLGVCLGMQVIAAVGGARIVPSGAPVHGKARRVWHEGRGLLRGLPSPLRVGLYQMTAMRELLPLPGSAARGPLAGADAAGPVRGDTDPVERVAALAGHRGTVWLDDRAVLSVSPERYLSVRDRRVWSEPIKGTRRRPGDRGRARRLERELLTSDKDAAELAMIVDLVRNDLGRVCRAGSVRVERFQDLMRLPGMLHTYARVGGRLRSGADVVDLDGRILEVGSTAAELLEALAP